jgi:hypothetical protein
MQALRESQTKRKPVKLCAGCTDKPGHSPLAFYRDFGSSKYARAAWNFKNKVKNKFKRRVFG